MVCTFICTINFCVAKLLVDTETFEARKKNASETVKNGHICELPYFY